MGVGHVQADLSINKFNRCSIVYSITEPAGVGEHFDNIEIAFASVHVHR